MPPEPDAHAILARAAYARLLEGEDAIKVLLDLARDAVTAERQRQAEREGWAEDARTPTVDLWGAQGPLPTRPAPPRPSQRPTAPLPLGVHGEQRRTPTSRGTPVPPPPKPPRRR